MKIDTEALQPGDMRVVVVRRHPQPPHHVLVAARLVTQAEIDSEALMDGAPANAANEAVFDVLGQSVGSGG